MTFPNFAIVRIAGAICMLMIYLVCLGGITVNAHYCGGSLASVSLGGSDNGENCCGKGKAPMKKNCCEDREFHLEKAGSHLSGITGTDIPLLFSPVLIMPVAVVPVFHTEHDPVVPVMADFSHPPDGKLFLQVRVLRI